VSRLISHLKGRIWREDRMIRKQGSRGTEKMKNQERHDFNSSTSIIIVIISVQMRWGSCDINTGEKKGIQDFGEEN
jgi:hypothetical protein